jgi:hypothetical protein
MSVMFATVSLGFGFDAMFWGIGVGQPEGRGGTVEDENSMEDKTMEEEMMDEEAEAEREVHMAEVIVGALPE